MTEKLGVSEKEPAFGQKTPTTNGKYSINSESFFKYDEGGRRGHSKNLFKTRTIILDIKNFIQQ